MADTQVSFGDLEARVARRETKVLLRTAVLVLIPGAAAAIWLWSTLSAIGEARSELRVVGNRLEKAKEDLSVVTRQKNTTVVELRDARKDLKSAKEAERLALLAADDAREAKKQAEADLTRTKAEKAQIAEDLKTLRTLADGYRQKNVELQNRLDETSKTLSQLQTKLREAAKFDQHRYNLQWREAKTVAGRLRRGGDLLSRISDLQQGNVGWDWLNQPQKGFTSPGFAERVLGAPLEKLQRTTEPPRPGDLVVYEAGYHMFYFEDSDGVKFVVGMTPIGIAALQYDFGPKRLFTLRTGISR